MIPSGGVSLRGLSYSIRKFRIWASCTHSVQLDLHGAYRPGYRHMHINTSMPTQRSRIMALKL